MTVLAPTRDLFLLEDLADADQTRELRPGIATRGAG
jgi:hypothetical protein